MEETAPLDREQLNVLLVEDDVDDALLATNAMNASSGVYFRVRHVTTLAQGIEVAGGGGFDVVILDLSLPDCTGLDTVTGFLSRHNGIPVVVLTGDTNTEVGVQAVRLGAQEHLTKQSVLHGDVLLAAVRHAIERFELLRQLRQHQDHLEDLVKDRTAALRKALTEVRQRDRAKSEFVSNVSHELKTPIASLLYAADNLLEGVKGPLPAPVMTYLRIMRRDGLRLQRTVEDILDLSRIDTGRLILNRAPVRFGVLCERVVAELQPNAANKGVDLFTNCREAGGFVMCDPAKIERVLVNVLGNAVKYTPQGGSVLVNAESDGAGRVAVTVTDSGVGIPEHAIEHVMERYYRVGQHIDGSGLGLAIAKEILEAHDGTIEIQSPPPGCATGTRVALRLPVCEAPTILVVDDDESVRMTIARQLEGEGYRVICCAEGQEALGALRGSSIGLMVLDMVMPGLSGIDVIAELKGEHHLHRLPVIVITGYAMDSFKRDFLENLDIPWLQKPWQAQDLINLVETQLIAAAENAGNETEDDETAVNSVKGRKSVRPVARKQAAVAKEISMAV